MRQEKLVQEPITRPDTVRWGHSRLTVRIDVRDGRPSLGLVTDAPVDQPGQAEGRPRTEQHAVASPGSRTPGLAGPGQGELPLVEALAVGHGRVRSGAKHVETSIGARLQLLGTTAGSSGSE